MWIFRIQRSLSPDNRDALEQLPVYVLNNTRNGLNLFNNYMMLTDDEVGIYNYIFNSEGRESADEWLESFKSVYNMRQGKYISDNTNPAYVAYASGLMILRKGSHNGSRMMPIFHLGRLPMYTPVKIHPV